MSAPSRTVPQLSTDQRDGQSRKSRTRSDGSRTQRLVETIAPARVRRMARVAAQEWIPSLLVFVLDVLLFALIYAGASYLRRDAYFTGPFQFAVIEIIQLAVIVQALFIIGGYSPQTETRGLSYTAEHILAMIGALIITALLIYSAAAFDHSMKPSRIVLLTSFILFTPLSLYYRRRFRVQLARAAAGRAFLVLGSGKEAADFYEAYRASANNQRLEFVALKEEQVGQRIAGAGSPVVQGDLPMKLRTMARRYSGIILAERIDRIQPELLDNLIRTQFQRTRVYTLESFYEAQWRQVPAHSIDPFWPLQAGFQLARTSPYHYAKRIFDMVAAGLGLILLAPVMLLISLLIYLSNGAPVIFKQRRVGRDDEVFTIYKFRTMRVAHSDGVEANIYTAANDPRLFRVGRWLRKLRLDELPQLWNVLNGELSLIGPRAEMIECVERYREKIPFYHFRHLVKPGITGWAQVNYPYGESEQDALAKLTYDLYYIRHYSLKLDAMILLKTIYTMVAGKGR
ncbi:MAG: exopolysaccharide biosynthesis polyprenyl glycosylphosphotransferase [Verrucomicrobia bacterium]|nr:exopolysaccharide biosynthesis polyprenyl glycosylphosphotransferase [Verrucomicrobiota bacterium]